MNYIKNCYNQLRFVDCPMEFKKNNYVVKTNNKYLIKNSILHPIFKDEYNIFKGQKYNIFSKNINNFEIVKKDSVQLEKDEIKYILDALHCSLNTIRAQNRENTGNYACSVCPVHQAYPVHKPRLKKHANFNNYACPFYYLEHLCTLGSETDIYSCNSIDYSDTVETNDDLESDNTMCSTINTNSYNFTGGNDHKNAGNDHKNAGNYTNTNKSAEDSEISLDNIFKNNLLIVFILSCYYFTKKFEK